MAHELEVWLFADRVGTLPIPPPNPRSEPPYGRGIDSGIEN